MKREIEKQHFSCFLGQLSIGIGVLCILYYLLLIAGQGLQISIVWIWLLGGIFLIGYGILINRMKKQGKQFFKKKWTSLLAKILFICMLVYFVCIEIWIVSGIFSKGREGLDYLIILGAGVYGTEPSPALEERVNTAIEYLQENPNTKVIVSGGQGKGEDISEAECMTRLLKEAGISVDRIVQEDKSTTTVENIQFSYSKITEDKAKIGIVTSNFHIARAVATAKAQGNFSVYGIAAPFTGGLLPHYMIREFLAFTVDGIWGYLF